MGIWAARIAQLATPWPPWGRKSGNLGTKIARLVTRVGPRLWRRAPPTVIEGARNGSTARIRTG
ncbi:hypothetical protein BN11_1340005 [Nostocoides australiense Ben110]|uniref:Uncharacterized protein n=1 Tax=Nostocoides australiense Ben110 TaxID=1193182 RepID=W6K1E1_9MICO|nr:hypothetical protein BN11_1340005 [Tetrasphaera australiensis Ben110]